MSTMFPPESLNNLLGGIVSDAGKRQLRIAETEKYAHVTFFFNGGEETPFPGEDRVLIPSPKIATYDLQPEMSAREVTERLVSEISSGKYDFILSTTPTRIWSAIPASCRRRKPRSGQSMTVSGGWPTR